MKPEFETVVKIELEKRKFVARVRNNTGNSSSSTTTVKVQKIPKAPGTITINTKPWAKIFVDGQPLGSTPIFKVKIKAGRHKVRLLNEAKGIDVTKSIVVKPGKLTKKNWKL
ncbi:MAG: PEGA domain-containing protein [Deltaproteobacteria bacterium]|nr:PEGA domain-containing protein [Deltaproteobacteria bacterium]